MAKINSTGEPCTKCNRPVIKRESKFKKSKLLKPYYYTAYFYCTFCKTRYMNNEFKVVNYHGKKRKSKNVNAKKIVPIWLTERPTNYSKYLKSKWWKYRRTLYWESHKRICFCCYGQATEIHHNNYENLGREKDKDLVPICRDCHEECHNLVINEKEIKLINAHIYLEAFIRMKID